MTTDNKDCSGCKWYKPSERFCAGGCVSQNVKQRLTFYARMTSGDCGPSAKYYEPKEQQP